VVDGRRYEPPRARGRLEPARHQRASRAARDHAARHRAADGHARRTNRRKSYTPGEHHGHHRFDNAEEWAERFEDPARDAWQKPEQVLDWLELQPTHKVADIGAATGYFPVRIAKRVPDGKVFGVDIEPSMVDCLNKRAGDEGIDNLIAVLALGFDGFNAADSANIPAQSTDGDESGSIDVTGQVDQGASDNKGMRLDVALVDYSDGTIDDPETDDVEEEISVLYDTAEGEPLHLALSLRDIPDGTLGGTLTAP
jgi:SAM-dependent methyltransferase